MSELNKEKNEKDDGAGVEKDERPTEFTSPGEGAPLEETISQSEVRVEGFEKRFTKKTESPSRQEDPLMKLIPDEDDEKLQERIERKMKSAGPVREIPSIKVSPPDDDDAFPSWPEKQTEISRPIFENVNSSERDDETFQEWFDRQTDLNPILDDSLEEFLSQQSVVSPNHDELPHCSSESNSGSAFASVSNFNPFPRITKDDSSVPNRFKTEKDPKRDTSSDCFGLSRSKSQPQAKPSFNFNFRGMSQKEPRLMKTKDPHLCYPMSGTKMKVLPEYFASPGTSKECYSQNERGNAQKEQSLESDLDYDDCSDDESVWSSTSSPSRAMAPAPLIQNPRKLKRSDLYHSKMEDSPFYEYHSYWDTDENRRIHYRIPMNERTHQKSLQTNENMMTTWTELTRIRERENARKALRINNSPTEFNKRPHTMESGSTSDLSPSMATENNDPPMHLVKPAAELKLRNIENSFSFAAQSFSFATPSFSFATPTSDDSKSQPIFGASRNSFSFAIPSEDGKKSESQPLFDASRSVFNFGSQSIFGFRDIKNEEKVAERNEKASSGFGEKTEAEESEEMKPIKGPNVSPMTEDSLPAVAETDQVQYDPQTFECRPPLLSETRDELKLENSDDKDDEDEEYLSCGESC